MSSFFLWRRMRAGVSRLTLGFLVLGLWGCVAPADPLPDVKKQDITAMTTANFNFAVDFYKAVKNDPKKENLFFSPYSISTALTMLYAGARKDTAAQIRAALRHTVADAELHAVNAWLLIDLNNRGRRGLFSLSTANRIWGNSGYPFAEEFLATLKDKYLAGLGEVDFQKDHEGARALINTWVADQTAQRIKDLMPKGSIDPTTVLVLTNAIYFKANWKIQFDPKSTRDRDFVVSPSKTIQVPMMHDGEMEVPLYEDSKVQALSLPYKGDELSLLVVLPKGQSLADLENSLVLDDIQRWSSQASKTKLPVALPKLKLTQTFDLKESLVALGIKDAFDQRADFSGIDNGQSKLVVQSAIHKSFLEVNEEGTEAAAATGIGVGLTSAPASSFVADRPFLFVILDKTTGNPLFFGRIQDPSKAE